MTPSPMDMQAPRPNDTMSALADASMAVLEWPPPHERPADCRYVVLVLAEHGPVAVSESGAAFRSAVVIGADVRLGDLTAAEGVSLLDLDPYGLVVMDADDSILGVAPAEVLDAFLGDGQPPSPRPMGPLDSSAAAQLHGRHSTPVAIVMCAATGCGYPNSLAFFDRMHPPTCGNRVLPAHTLAVPGRA